MYFIPPTTAKPLPISNTAAIVAMAKSNLIYSSLAVALRALDLSRWYIESLNREDAKRVLRYIDLSTSYCIQQSDQVKILLGLKSKGFVETVGANDFGFTESPQYAKAFSDMEKVKEFLKLHSMIVKERVFIPIVVTDEMIDFYANRDPI